MIGDHSAKRASEEASKIWAIDSAQYPLNGGALIQGHIEVAAIDSVTEMSVHGRRALEGWNIKENIYLQQKRWKWAPIKNAPIVTELRDAFNRVLHAQDLVVGFEKCPESTCVIDGGSIVIPYLMARTDRRPTSYIDLFSMAHAWLHGALPAIHKIDPKAAQQGGAPDAFGAGDC